MKRYAAVLGLKPEAVEDYVRVHAAVWPDVLAQIRRSNIRNYSIYLKRPENLLFSYFEYVGTDYEADMAAIGAQHFSRPVRLWEVPRWLLDAIAASISRIASVTGKPPMLTPPKLRELRHPDWVVDNDAITRATGWTPKIRLTDGLAQLKLPPL